MGVLLYKVYIKWVFHCIGVTLCGCSTVLELRYTSVVLYKGGVIWVALYGKYATY